ncbi:MAG: hypothetical protein JJU01_04320, partial [Alkalibacterium sp.]|nr:hypothetical protein [Alkalibacterium sp.]
MVTEKMKPDECEAVSALIADAFYSKFRPKVKLSKRELQTIISRIWLGEADNLGLSLWTVKKNGHIVGAYGLSEYVETQITPSLIGKLTAVIKHLGLLRFFKFIKILIETNHRLGRNELYIDFIAVK